MQRDFAANPPYEAKGVVLDGRDIGTVVLPDADVKLFVTASQEVRAERRLKELQGKVVSATKEDVLANIRKRDVRDSQRTIAPLRSAADAILIDNSSPDISNAFEEAMRQITNKLALKKTEPLGVVLGRRQ